MSLAEKAGYLRGLYDGMELNEDKSKEAKLLKAIIDVVVELADHVTENEESIMALADQADELFGDVLDDAEPYDGDEDEGDYETAVEVECPSCGEPMTIHEGHLASGEVKCPSCGQRFQIELEFEEEDGDDEEIPF
ncbi:MAG: zinc ribbon domain-containing protein [Clostridiales bacterium]|nr:zinc ribbon domain-containing protein [Clostridiales bacterium]